MIDLPTSCWPGHDDAAIRTHALHDALVAISNLPLYPQAVQEPNFANGVRLGREQAKDAVRALLNVEQTPEVT